MDASRYFDAMHNAMSTLHAGAQLLLTIRDSAQVHSVKG